LDNVTSKAVAVAYSKTESINQTPQTKNKTEIHSLVNLEQVQDGEVCKKTNLVDGGLPSADRNNKATLLLTGPYRTIKSYAKDLSPRMVKLQDAS
jgi:hypothetical protein